MEMESVETESETIDKAIDNALKVLGVERDKVTVDILTEGRKGILGFGSQKARIRASLRRSLLADEEPVGKQLPEEKRITDEEAAALGQKGREVLAEILRLMGVPSTVNVKPGETAEEVSLDIHGDCGSLLIGRKGQTLEALQYLVMRITGEGQGREGPQLVIDTGNYRARKRKNLEDMALRFGEKAKRQRKTVTVNALTAADRRIIHVALQDDPWLTTRSLGTGAYRRLLIIPEGDRKKRGQEKGPLSGRQESKGRK
ncbi:MAG: RNA-binding cell elongation regulator Jag/EloR [Candidatus Binatia bacterium]